VMWEGREIIMAVLVSICWLGFLDGVGYVGTCSEKLLDIVWVVLMMMSFWKPVASEQKRIYVLSIVLYVEASLRLSLCLVVLDRDMIPLLAVETGSC
jgi:hypothetical protein